jgi:hypothetical protein
MTSLRVSAPSSSNSVSAGTVRGRQCLELGIEIVCLSRAAPSYETATLMEMYFRQPR